MRTGISSVTAGDTEVLMVADLQKLLGERSRVPDAGRPNPGTVDWHLTLGTRVFLYGMQISGSGALEFRVNACHNSTVATPGWVQIAMFPLTTMPIMVEIPWAAPYIRIDLGALVTGSAAWGVSIRGPQ
jgi:hypothetical protein